MILLAIFRAIRRAIHRNSPRSSQFAATAVFAGIGVATAAQTFSCLLEDATLLRNENDLTV